MGMTAAAGGHKGGRRRRGVPRYGAMADINMTPFIDVMLVLLIIFMVAAPLLATGVPIDLPHTKAAALNVDHQPLAVAVDEKGLVYLMDKPVPVEQLADRLKDAAKNGFDERIYVRGASQVDYGTVAKVMTIITGAGYKKVALVTDPSKN
jgi:biopolymer transport protein TolR